MSVQEGGIVDTPAQRLRECVDLGLRSLCRTLTRSLALNGLSRGRLVAALVHFFQFGKSLLRCVARKALGPVRRCLGLALSWLHLCVIKADSLGCRLRQGGAKDGGGAAVHSIEVGVPRQAEELLLVAARAPNRVGVAAWNRRNLEASAAVLAGDDWGCQSRRCWYWAWGSDVLGILGSRQFRLQCI